MITVYGVECGHLAPLAWEDGTPLPATAVWIDLLSPTTAEEEAVERATGIDLPTQAKLQEIEMSSRWMRPPMDEVSVLAGPQQTVVRSACYAVREIQRPLIVFTWSGATALVASKSRPPGPIFALTPNQTTYDRLALAWGVTPVLAPNVLSTDELVVIGEKILLQEGHLHRGQEVVVLAGNTPMKGATNTMKVYTVGNA